MVRQPPDSHPMSPRLPLVLACISFSAAVAAAQDGGPAVTWPEVKLRRFAAVPEGFEPLPAPRPVEAKAPRLSEAKNAEAVLKEAGIRLTDEQRAFLDEHRFVLVPITASRLAGRFAGGEEDAGEPDEMLNVFSAMTGGGSGPFDRRPSCSKLITPDVALHAWHRHFSHLLEHVEARQLKPRLERMLGDCVVNAALMATAEKDWDRAQRLRRVQAQFAAAWVLLGSDEPPAEPRPDEFETDPAEEPEQLAASLPEDPRPLEARLAYAKARLPEDLAEALETEVKAVLALEGPERSPLFGRYDRDKTADWTQFRPRSHYTKSASLRAWFRSMMFLGRNGWALRGDEGMGDALLAVSVLCEPGPFGRPPLEEWQRLMEMTTFFAGESDDIAYPELRAWVMKQDGDATLTTEEALDPARLAKRRAALQTLRPPRIVGDARGKEGPAAAERVEFRLFGQRFGRDAWVIDPLLDHDGSGRRPSLVSGTVVMAAFGSGAAAEAARGFLRETGGDKAAAWIADFDKQLPDLADGLAAVKEDEWFSCMAAKQLHTIGQLAVPAGEWAPAYMRSPLFPRRQLGAMMGSYAELKHDTVLYAKQNYAELGEGGESNAKPPPPPRGFVQPDLWFWSEMTRLAAYAAEGVRAHRLVADAGEEFSTLERFRKDMDFCRRMALKEVSGKPLTEEEWDRLWQFDLLYMDESNFDGSMMSAPDADRGKTAVVTDIMTDGGGGRVLQIGTGRPLLMLALVAHEATPRLVLGTAYDAHEFIGPAARRLTDEEWRKGLYGEEPKSRQRPSWAVPVPKSAKPVRME